MKKTGNLNVNTKLYWNHIYTAKNDQEEIDKRSHFTEDEITDPRTGHFIQNSKRFVTALSYVREGDRVLDIGCGFGLFTGAVVDKFPYNETWGVDISNEVIEANKEKHPEVAYFQQYVGHLDKVPTNYFNLVFSGEVLEHLEEPAQLLKDAHAALKTGGKLIITTPLDRMIDSPEHVWYFDKSDVKELYLNNGFENVEFIDLPKMEKSWVIFAIGTKK